MESSASVVLRTDSMGLHNVFVYGSLQAEEVVKVLLKRIPRTSPATLNNYHRFSIKERVYPAILPVADKKVTGKVLSEITDPELLVLDAFEDVEYERQTVDVTLSDTSEKLKVFAYVWRNSTDPALYGEWDLEEWKKVHMKDFVKMTMGFAQELEHPEAKPRVEAYESFYQQDKKKTP
ncbi:hypothetical protein DCAR_0100462 [Daucus carota subsp. sativus]|uniref:Putative gamma-glutamylcyclotransferase n=1 Tax=Daucus carota subsp. sativus TaxID=79200 RepID=A0AAF1AIB5_DAUCS|nr:PREDICTED: AIG2-like protein [Daucus carota subsp. sativus]WOG81316.1 hypothetical protein DCAR_0100462 [Daucus carota subsp. sativus]